MKNYWLTAIVAATNYGLSALNVAYAFNSPEPSWNWATAVFCFGFGIFLGQVTAINLYVGLKQETLQWQRKWIK